MIFLHAWHENLSFSLCPDGKKSIGTMFAHRGRNIFKACLLNILKTEQNYILLLLI